MGRARQHYSRCVWWRNCSWIGIAGASASCARRDWDWEEFHLPRTLGLTQGVLLMILRVFACAGPVHSWMQSWSHSFSFALQFAYAAFACLCGQFPPNNRFWRVQFLLASWKHFNQLKKWIEMTRNAKKKNCSYSTCRAPVHFVAKYLAGSPWVHSGFTLNKEETQKTDKMQSWCSTRGSILTWTFI